MVTTAVAVSDEDRGVPIVAVDVADVEGGVPTVVIALVAGCVTAWSMIGAIDDVSTAER